ncbi:hypothetical protein [Actinoplanes sp. DH11]|nr:hypothetical protein [Actinoplanes sp. DH11]
MPSSTRFAAIGAEIGATPAQRARLDPPRPAAGARHDDANMASIDQ